jgi:hypothetical protein
VSAPPPQAEKKAPPRRAAPKESPDYVTDLPSIVPTSPRPASPLPAPPPPLMPKPLPRRFPLRPVLVGVGALAVGAAAFMTLKSLQKAPVVVLGLTPPSVQAGQDLAITGEGFDPRPEGNTVRFGEKVGQALSADETRVVARTPEGLLEKGAVSVPVSVEAHGQRSNSLLVRVYVAPKVLAVEPPVAMPGEEVTLTGQNLEGSPITATMAGVSAEVLRHQADSVVLRVPELSGRQGDPQPVTLAVGRDHTTTQLVLGRMPLVTDVMPPRAAVGQSVVLRGYGFDPDPAANQVRFGDRPALVIAATPVELLVAVPSVGNVAEPRELDVVVTASGRTSAAKRFQVFRASAVRYVPRFFPAVVPGQSTTRHALVATELSPLLLLSGAAESGSVAARAAQVAQRLNALASVAASQPVTLSVLSGPPRIVAGGHDEAVVTVTEEDAAGFAQPWAGGRRGTPQLLAEYWAALLQDYLLLFAQRDRPYRTLELRAEGEVFTKLHGDAVRLAGVGGGVPMHLVSPLDPAVGEALKRLALSLPVERRATGVAALAGRWRGTMTLTGQAPRAILLDLRLSGSRLGGTLSTRVGKVSGEVSLQDVSYQGSTLEFTFDSGGNPQHFRGRFEGSTIEGTIAARPDQQQPTGRFSLEFSR